MDLRAINAVSGVPVVSVGLIMAWGSDNSPQDPEKWLECDGRAFSAATYPDLANIYPGLRVPDYRGQFLRGGSVAQVGQVAADSMRSHAHQIDKHSHTVTGSASGQSYSAPSSSGGSFLYIHDTGYPTTYSMGGVPQSSWSTEWRPSGGGYRSVTSGNNTGGGGDVSFAMPVGGGGSTAAITGGGSITGIANAGGPTSTYASGETETAPQHIKVRYLIRALP